MTDIDALIKRMTDRFLQWKLPENFQPDCGIEFDRNKYVRLNPMNRPFEPVGTNLFSSTQAEAMVKAIAGDEIEALIEALTAEREKVAKLEAEVEIAEAKGWRDAVTCVQYCAANWSQDCRSEAERKALEDASEELVLELVTCSPGEWLGSEWKTAQDYIAAITKLEAEVKRLNKCLTYEQHRAGRQGTHAPGCHEWGPQHYECLKAEAARWRVVAGELAGALDKELVEAVNCWLHHYGENPEGSAEPEHIARGRAALTRYKQESGQ